MLVGWVVWIALSSLDVAGPHRGTHCEFCLTGLSRSHRGSSPIVSCCVLCFSLHRAQPLWSAMSDSEKPASEAPDETEDAPAPASTADGVVEDLELEKDLSHAFDDALGVSAGAMTESQSVMESCRICLKKFVRAKMVNAGSKRYASWRDTDCHNAVKRLESAAKEDTSGEQLKAFKSLKKDKEHFKLKVLELVSLQKAKGDSQRMQNKQFLDRLVVSNKVLRRTGIWMFDEPAWIAYHRFQRNCTDEEAKATWTAAFRNPDHPRETEDGVVHLAQKMPKMVAHDQEVGQHREIASAAVEVKPGDGERLAYNQTMGLASGTPWDMAFTGVGSDLLRSGPRAVVPGLGPDEASRGRSRSRRRRRRSPSTSHSSPASPQKGDGSDEGQSGEEESSVVSRASLGAKRSSASNSAAASSGKRRLSSKTAAPPNLAPKVAEYS